MLVPSTIEGWTKEAIEALAASSTGEHKRFDFKSASAIRADSARRVSATVCAFANTEGGFLVFGVDERPTKDGWTCNPGPVNTEASKLINDKIKVDPMPSFPPPEAISAGKGKAYYVLHVPVSPYVAHASEGVYYYRTLSGNESMPPEMLRERILGEAERRGRVKVLLQELDEIFIQAKSHNGIDPSGQGPELTPLDPTTMLRMRAELLLPMSRDADAVESLRLAASAIRTFNANIELARQQFSNPSLPPRKKQEWSAIMHQQGKVVASAVNRARLGVGRVFGEQVGNWASQV